MGYEIRIVSNEEFDTLPYKKAKTSLGLADPKTGVAYVRETGVRELDQATIDHEFDELIQQVSPHEEDGIRYKSGGGLGSILGPVIGAILTPFIGPGGPIVGGLISGGTQGYSQSKKPEKYGKPSFMSIGGSALKGAAGAYLGGKALTGGIAGGSAAGPGFLSKAGGIASGALGGTPAVAGGPATTSYGVAVPSTFTPATAGAFGAGGSVFGSGTAASKAAQTQWGASAGSGASSAAAPSILQKFGQYGLEGAKNLATSTGTNSILGSLQPQQQQNGSLFPSGRTPASNVGQFETQVTPGALSRFLPNTQSEYAPGSDYTEAVTQDQYNQGITGIRGSQTSRLQSVMDQFRGIRPGASPETDTALARALGNVNVSSQAEIDQFMKEANEANTAKYGQYQNVQMYNDIMNTNSLKPEQMKFYIDLAKKSDAEISAQVGNTPDEFRSIFGSLTDIG